MVRLTQVFCSFLETLTDVANDLVDTDLLVLSYGAISDIPETNSGSYWPGPISPGTFTLSYHQAKHHNVRPGDSRGSALHHNGTENLPTTNSTFNI